MAEKKTPPNMPLEGWVELVEAMNAAGRAGIVGKPPRLADPVSGARDFELTKDYGQKAAYDWPGLLFDPAKQLDYADRLGRAWIALWRGWMGQESRTADPRPYDIFLSHSKRDEARVREIEQAFMADGYPVYIDWLEDPLLDRTHVDRATALKLQERMRQCKALVLALSAESAASPWVQWELGFFDALRGRIFILPLDAEAQRAVARQEYYELYTVLDPADYRADFLRRYAAAIR